MHDMRDLSELQSDIGYSFDDPSLLETAIRHSSYVHEQGLPMTACNERLEFLGDAVLELIISRLLFTAYPEKPEGDLTRLRAGLVCAPALAENARRLCLGDYLCLGNGEEKTGGRQKESLLCDVMEALIGAIYLDGGLPAAETFVHAHLWSGEGRRQALRDFKTALQEKLQEKGRANVRYETAPCTEATAKASFCARVYVQETCLGSGMGHSKKAAEQRAAEEALRTLCRTQ